jgi:hypothetical protein
MQGILFDRAEIVAGVPKDQFAGCEGRITIEGGSFFEWVPDGCEAYILKHIIHDWSDEHCVRARPLSCRLRRPAHSPPVYTRAMALRGVPEAGAAPRC